jgi:RNA polymerase-binding transcription factor DksA
MAEHRDAAPGDVLEDAGRVLDLIEAALHRLEEASYGRCEECGEVIDDAELEPEPFATRGSVHGE